MSRFNHNAPKASALKDEMLANNFHCMDFVYNGIECQLAGWYVLVFGDDRDNRYEFDTPEEVFTAKVFDGRTLEEVFDELEDLDVTLWD